MAWPAILMAAEVNFDDGGSYTIHDTTYQFDSINLSNGSSLIIEPGAVVDGVFAYDTSTVTVEGMSFDTSAFFPPFGGILTVTYCSGATGSFEIFALSESATVTLVATPPCVIDSDGDGVADDADQCPNSDLRSTVWVGSCDSGVSNDYSDASVDSNGCSLADRIARQLTIAATGARNHGQFVRTMAHYFDSLMSGGVITSNEQVSLMSCVGAADERQFRH